MKVYLDKKTERAYFYAPKAFNTNNIAYWVMYVREHYDTDTDVYMTQAQYDAIEANDDDAEFFAIINAGLYVVNS